MPAKYSWALCVAVLFLASCDPDLNAVSPPCGPGGTCPAGMVCGSGGRCVPEARDGPLDRDGPAGEKGGPKDIEGPDEGGGPAGPLVLLEQAFSTSGPLDQDPQVKLVQTSFVLGDQLCNTTDNLCLIGGIGP